MYCKNVAIAHKWRNIFSRLKSLKQEACNVRQPRALIRVKMALKMCIIRCMFSHVIVFNRWGFKNREFFNVSGFYSCETRLFMDKVIFICLRQGHNRSSLSSTDECMAAVVGRIQYMCCSWDLATVHGCWNWTIMGGIAEPRITIALYWCCGIMSR